ncbi:MAG: class I SAM-dependent methyltransferase [Rhizobiaceae bacterium]|nr:class I SAM-dependent methyltransferase [Rhizobiaceae bacterium]
MLSETAVVNAYRLILGRDPESPEVVAYHRSHPDEAVLRKTLLSSPEFAALYDQLGDAELKLNSDRDALPPAARVEVEAQGEAGATLWARVAKSWTEMGQSVPHWSVLTFDQFRPEALEENRAVFENSAEIDGRLVDAALERFAGGSSPAKAKTPAQATCLEIGCGVGRATRALARRFGKVVGVDISSAHLAVADQELKRAGFRNVALRHMARIEDYETLPQVDFLYSRIVLQHNPPPVQAAILRTALSRLAPGGIALFQVVTYARDYAYDVASDLARQGGMEMHVLPQATVFAILDDSGVVPVEVQEDDAAGDDERFRSHLFLAQKRG